MEDRQLIAKTCILAGKIMLESGAETYRVEDTMNRIAAAYGLHDAQSYATPTGIHFATESASIPGFVRISKRTTDLEKIADVNSISRAIAAGQHTVADAHSLLLNLRQVNQMYPVWLQLAAAAVASGSFTIMFGGVWMDFLPALLAGGGGFATMLVMERFLQIRFMAEFIASLVIGLLALFFVYIGFGMVLDKIIIGAVMPLVPGLPITNAVRDLMAGHLVAGVSKGVEALLTACAIGAGVATVLTFL
ncbi:threonine/serine exporter family protein [Virgibacillus sp. 179-BFC.A HS]|uniref:Threonine/serine exporter family protein n=1 Tax=Tigheibacillus jepli TaxID=3035914 RepID=A0ABU5CE48_9BACI|nr:threonine/serine exporter family protein [Virgibacillus sp. 179-BFC.A HS]MDY0404593.1 threonine/serine exporter family protein [Virgibacillus sp. 179-BFC.A HS]